MWIRFLPCGKTIGSNVPVDRCHLQWDCTTRCALQTIYCITNNAVTIILMNEHKNKENLRHKAKSFYFPIIWSAIMLTNVYVHFENEIICVWMCKCAHSYHILLCFFLVQFYVERTQFTIKYYVCNVYGFIRTPTRIKGSLTFECDSKIAKKK